uniref:Uncharacterized protein n=1 Tax=Anguilla anguilla TaxID=7936 RepID=A0A0E9VHJ6_ANGAN
MHRNLFIGAVRRHFTWGKVIENHKSITEFLSVSTNHMKMHLSHSQILKCKTVCV